MGPLDDIDGELALFVVTRGISHILMTNGEWDLTWFVHRRRRLIPGGVDEGYEEPRIKVSNSHSWSMKTFLGQNWPQPCQFNDTNSAIEHAAYLSLLPIFKDRPNQKSWGWWRS